MKTSILTLVLLATTISEFVKADDLSVLFVKYAKNEATVPEIQVIHEKVKAFKYEENRCHFCQNAFQALATLIRANISDEVIYNVSRTVCNQDFYMASVCKGLVELHMPIIKYIIKNTPDATPSSFCGLLYQSKSCPLNDSRFEWRVELPPYIEINKKRQDLVTNKPLKIALLSDLHVDPLYEPGSAAVCDEIACCRKGQKPKWKKAVLIIQTNIDVAYEADDVKVVPALTLEVAVATVATFRDIDFLYYMGDNIDHHTWETTYEQNKYVTSFIVNQMKQKLGNRIVVIPTIGNHEPQPTDQFAPPSVQGEGLNTTWLYENLADQWGSYLTQEATDSFRQTGSYSMLIRNGLRVISFNDNFPYRYNWWLVHDPLEAKRQLEWLINELWKAEKEGDKVHLIAHIPPGDEDLTYTWTREFHRVIERFSNTIAAHFTGHTHADDSKLLYDSKDKPIHVAWGAGSATPMVYVNPNYKIATFDTDTFKPIEISTYIFDLKKANLTPKKSPYWFKLYDMTKIYDLEDLSPESVDRLVHEMVTNKKFLLDIYTEFVSKYSLQNTCGHECKINLLCKTVITVLWDDRKCQELRSLYLS